MRHFPKGTLVAPNALDGPVEIDPGERIVETRGFMTLKQQVDRALAAGILHEQWRREHFPPDVSVPDDFVPVDYAPEEQDLMVEYQAMVDGRTRALARVKAAEEKAAREAVEASEEPPVEPPA